MAELQEASLSPVELRARFGSRIVDALIVAEEQGLVRWRPCSSQVSNYEALAKKLARKAPQPGYWYIPQRSRPETLQ